MPEYYQQFSEAPEFSAMSPEDKLKFGELYADQMILSDPKYQADPEFGSFLKQQITKDIQAELGITEPEKTGPTQAQYFEALGKVFGPGVAGDVQQTLEGFQKDIGWLKTIGDRPITENPGAIGETTANIALHTAGVPGRLVSGLAQVPHAIGSAVLEAAGFGDSAANKWFKASYDSLERGKQQMIFFNNFMTQYEPDVLMAAGLGAGVSAGIHKLTHRALTALSAAAGTPGFTATDAAIVGGWTAAVGEAGVVAPITKVTEHYIDESGYSAETKQTLRVVAPIVAGLFSGLTVEHIMDRFLRNPLLVDDVVRAVAKGADPAEVARIVEPEIVKAPEIVPIVSKATNGRVPEQLITPTYGKNLTIEGKETLALPIVGRITPGKIVTPKRIQIAVGDTTITKPQKSVPDAVRHYVGRMIDTANLYRQRIEKLGPDADKAKIQKFRDMIDKEENRALVNAEKIHALNDIETIRMVDQALMGEPIVMTKQQMLVSDTLESDQAINTIAEIITKASNEASEEVARGRFLEGIGEAWKRGDLSLEDAKRAQALSEDKAKGWLFNTEIDDVTKTLKDIGITGQENSALGKFVDATINNQSGYVDPQFIRMTAIHSIPLLTGFESKDGELNWNVNKYLKNGAWLNALGIGGRVYRRIGVNRIARDVSSKASRKFWNMVENPFLNSFRPGSGLQPEVHDLRKAFRAQKQKFRRETDEFAIQLKKNYTDEERDLMSDFIEKEGNDWSTVPDKLQKQAQEITHFLGQIRTQLVDSGIPEELVNRHGDAWLHRVYLPQLMKKPTYKRARASLKSIQAGYVKDRGKNANLVNKLEQMEMRQEDFVKGDKVYSFVDDETKKVWIHESQVEKLEDARKNFTSEREWEVRENAKNPLKVNTDYSKTEREMMGESRDVALRLAVFFREASHDIALGNMFKGIAEDERFAMLKRPGVKVKDLDKAAREAGFVKLSEKTTPSGVKKFGALAGQWVHPDVERVLSRMTKKRYESEWEETWKTFLSQSLTAWKIGKTAYNPATHTLNIVSNMHLAFMAGHNPITITSDGIQTLVTKDSFFREAIDAGLIDTGVLRGEWNLDSFTKATKDLTPDYDNMPALARAMAKAYGGAKAVAKFPMTMYQWEDEVMKLGMFKQLRKQGMSPEEALAEANRWFFDYSDVPEGIEWLRDTGIMPFISFTYKVIPAMVRGTVDRPERLIAMIMMYKTISDLSYEKQFGEKAEAQMKLERELQPEFRKQGFFGVGPSTQIRLPSAKETGEARYLDVTRYIPGADLFSDFADSFPFGTNPAISLIYSAFSGKQAFSGRSVVPFPDPQNEYQESRNFDAWAKFVTNTVLPNVPGIPYTYSTDRIGNALVAEGDINEESGWLWDYAQRMGWDGKNFFGHDVDFTEEALSTVGIKTSRMDVEQAAGMAIQRRAAAFGRASRELSRELSKTRTTEARRQAAVEGFQEQIGTASQELEALTTLLESTQ